MVRGILPDLGHESTLKADPSPEQDYAVLQPISKPHSARTQTQLNSKAARACTCTACSYLEARGVAEVRFRRLRVIVAAVTLTHHISNTTHHASHRTPRICAEPRMCSGQRTHLPQRRRACEWSDQTHRTDYPIDSGIWRLHLQSNDNRRL